MLELEESLHDDDNVYHYRPAGRQQSDTLPKINHVSAGGHHVDVDYPSHTDQDEDGAGRPFVHRASLMLSLGVGAGVVLVFVILGAVCGVTWRNRRRRRKSVDRLPPVVDSYALVPLSSRRPDADPLPAVDVSSPGPRRTPPSAATTPRSSRSATGARAPVTSTSVQQLEWQRMLRTTECDDVISYEEDDVSGPPLPPPPAFVLRGAGSGRRAPLVVDEILDGYHSGDNVDDDIERIGVVDASSAPSRPRHSSRR